MSINLTVDLEKLEQVDLLSCLNDIKRVYEYKLKISEQKVEGKKLDAFQVVLLTRKVALITKLNKLMPNCLDLILD